MNLYDNPVLIGLAVKLIVTFIGLVLVPILLSRNNTRIGADFKTDVQEIRKSPTASAIFHGLVFVGMCTLLGLLFG